jgi:hypothetical protein
LTLLNPFQAVFQFVPDPLPPLGRTYQLAADAALTQIEQLKMIQTKYFVFILITPPKSLRWRHETGKT